MSDIKYHDSFNLRSVDTSRLPSPQDLDQDAKFQPLEFKLKRRRLGLAVASALAVASLVVIQNETPKTETNPERQYTSCDEAAYAQAAYTGSSQCEEPTAIYSAPSAPESPTP